MTRRARGRGNWRTRRAAATTSDTTLDTPTAAATDTTTMPLPPPPPPPMLVVKDDPLEDAEPAQEIKSEAGVDNQSEQNNPSIEMETADVNGETKQDPDEEMKESHLDDTLPFENSASGQEEGKEEEKEDGAYKPPWKRPRGTRMKRKKVPGAKNLRIKKYAQPKNAVMCLNELDPGIAYITEQEGGISQPFCMSVEIGGQKYRGFGSSKQLAKQAAAEAALISFVKPPVPNTENKEEDKTPWATLVSFALYKLFSDWREGRVGMCPPPSQFSGVALPTGQMLSGFKGFTPPPIPEAIVEKEEAQETTFVEAISAHLSGRPASTPTPEPKPEGKVLPKPAKQIPEGASSMHPVMVLNQMRPGLQYNLCETVRDSKPFFTMFTQIDDKKFTGEGTNVKKAKLSLAKTAIHELYGIESTFEG